MFHPGRRLSNIVDANFTSTASPGTVITASGTTHTKGSYTEIIASTAGDAYGIVIGAAGVTVSATVTAVLLDLAIGAAAAEQIIIPDLGCGAAPNNNSGGHKFWYFPLFIPSGSRISARMQAAIASDTCTIMLYLLDGARHERNCLGQRVTTYGVVAASSRGTNVTAGNAVYGTATTLAASTTNPIRYMQMSNGQGGDVSLSSYTVRARILAGASQVIVDDLALGSNVAEWMNNEVANLGLSQLAFDIPAGIDLRVAARLEGSTNLVHDYLIHAIG